MVNMFIYIFIYHNNNNYYYYLHSNHTHACYQLCFKIFLHHVANQSMNMYLFNYLSMYLPTYPPTYLFIYLYTSIKLSILTYYIVLSVLPKKADNPSKLKQEDSIGYSASIYVTTCFERESQTFREQSSDPVI
jgi:hypothetical protein